MLRSFVLLANMVLAMSGPSEGCPADNTATTAMVFVNRQAHPPSYTICNGFACTGLPLSSTRAELCRQLFRVKHYEMVFWQGGSRCHYVDGYSLGKVLGGQYLSLGLIPVAPVGECRGGLMRGMTENLCKCGMQPDTLASTSEAPTASPDETEDTESLETTESPESPEDTPSTTRKPSTPRAAVTWILFNLNVWKRNTTVYVSTPLGIGTCVLIGVLLLCIFAASVARRRWSTPGLHSALGPVQKEPAHKGPAKASIELKCELRPWLFCGHSGHGAETTEATEPLVASHETAPETAPETA